MSTEDCPASDGNSEMKKFSIGCKTFRDGVTTSFVFFITGLCLVMSGIWVMPEIWYLPHIIIFVGILILLMAPVILVASYFKNR